MKILMISPYLPWPLHSGGSVRIFNLLNGLSRRRHRIVLLAGHEDGQLAPDHILKRICQAVHLYELPLKNRLGSTFQSIFSPYPYPISKFLSDSLRESVLRLLDDQNFDLVWVNPLVPLDVIPSNIIKNIPVVVDQHECEELVYQAYFREGNPGERLFSLFNLFKLRNFKQRIFSQVSAILCVSKEEADFTQNQAKGKVKVWVVPNGVDKEFFCPPPFLENKANRILLCSNMSVRRNIDAAVWFTKHIFPEIKKQISDAEFWIVGSSPRREVRVLQGVPGVRVTGTVEDVRTYYAKTKVVVAPYRFGAGTKIKVLEAMASGVPIVSTKAGCQGIEVVEGEHLLMADNENDFANRVIELLTNLEKGQKLALAGRKLVEEKYRWEKIVDELEPKILELVSQQK